MVKINGYNIGDIYKVITTTTPTGSINSTSNTLINSILIPANTFTTGDIVTIETCVTKSSTINTHTQRFLINTSATLMLATQIATVTGTAATRAFQLFRRLSIVNSSGSGDATKVISSTFNARDDIGVGNYTGGFSTLSINWTVDQYLIVSGSVVSTSDTLSCQWIKASNG